MRDLNPDDIDSLVCMAVIVSMCSVVFVTFGCLAFVCMFLEPEIRWSDLPLPSPSIFSSLNTYP